jgi:hypothetical protein
LTAQAKDVTYQAFVARQSGIGALLEQVFPSGEFTILQLSLALNSLVGAVWQDAGLPCYKCLIGHVLGLSRQACHDIFKLSD